MAQITDDLEKKTNTFGDPVVSALYAIAFQLSRLNDNIEDVTSAHEDGADYVRTLQVRS